MADETQHPEKEHPKQRYRDSGCDAARIPNKRERTP